MPAGAVRRLFEPVLIGSRRYPSIGFVVLAAAGAFLLALIVTSFWMNGGDNLAYWIAGNRLVHGQAIYRLGEVAFAPFAYHYPPPLAQILAPITLVVPAVAYAAIYRGLLLLALWQVAGRSFLPTLALIAFIPVANSLAVENVEIFMALGIVFGLRRWPWLFAIGSLIKVSPGLGLVYLALRRRWRDFVIAALVGAGITVVSFLLDPGLWLAALDSISGRGGIVGNSLIPVPYVVRAIAGLVLTVIGGLLGGRRGELLLVGGITIANPGLSFQGFAVLIAAIPIWKAGPDGLGGAAEAAQRERASGRSIEAAGPQPSGG